ncbi:MAG TPA: Uma2 family endonuclease [Azospirillum sp.]
MVAVRKPAEPLLSVEDFLDWPGDGTDTRYQLVAGEPQAMAPASEVHGTIQANAAFLLKSHLRSGRSGCRVVTEAPVAPRLSSDMDLRVPDLAVTCTPSVPESRIVQAPILIIEILSPSNERETRANVYACATIPSVREILLLRSTRVGAELFRRQADGAWPAEALAVDPGDAVTLESIGFHGRLLDFYDGTHLVQSA